MPKRRMRCGRWRGGSAISWMLQDPRDAARSDRWRNTAMTTRLRRMIDTVRTVRQDTRTWTYHLTGEGPTTVRRQREDAAQTLATTRPNAPAVSVEVRPTHPPVSVGIDRFQHAPGDLVGEAGLFV